MSNYHMFSEKKCLFTKPLTSNWGFGNKYNFPNRFFRLILISDK